MLYRQRGGIRHQIVLWFPIDRKWEEVEFYSSQSREQLEDIVRQLYPGSEVWSWAAPEDYLPVEELCKSAN